MKNNLISSIASWKSAALLGLVALIATVAFSGLLTNTQTAEAAKLGDARVGGTASVSANVPDGAYARFTLTGSATFASGAGTSLDCGDGTTCDTNPASGVVTVTVNVAADAAVGSLIIVTRGEVGETPTTDYFVVIGSAANTPGSLTVKASKTTVGASAAVTITATVKNSVTPTAGAMSGQEVKFRSNLGGITCDTADGTQGCKENTDSAGEADAELSGPGSAGKATVTVTHATLGSKTLTITFSGPAKNVDVAPNVSAIQVGGETYAVVTLTDSAGNPVAEAASSESKATAPEGATGLKVGLATNVVQDAAPVVANTDAADATKNKPGAGDLPACSTPATSETLPYDDQATAWGTTNSDGKCVVKVTAAKGATAAASAAHGVHTISVSFGTGAAKVTGTAEVTVGGPPAEIDHNAPMRVTDLLSSTVIEYTVLDSEGRAVGVVDVEVDKISGDGLIKNASSKTSDGKAKFTYVAAGRSGSVDIRVAAGAKGPDGNLVAAHAVMITIHVGPEPVAAPAPTWSETPGSGWNLLVWNGEDGASVADGITAGVQSVYGWNGTSFDAYFVDAEGIANANTLHSLEQGSAYWVFSN